jgi:hypothetical protein
LECGYEGPIWFSEALEVLPKAFEKFSEIEVAPLFASEGRKTLAEVMESAFLGFLSNMGSELHQVGIGQLVPSHSKVVAILIVPGDLDSQDPNAIVDSVKAKLDAADRGHSERKRFFREGEFEREIYWARFVPPTRVGKTEPKSFRERVMEDWQGDWPLELTETVWRAAYGTTPILLFAWGVVVADTTDKLEGLQAINTFFSACEFAGHLCSPTTLYELGDMSVSPSGCIGSGGAGPCRPSFRNQRRDLPVGPLRKGVESGQPRILR